MSPKGLGGAWLLTQSQLFDQFQISKLEETRSRQGQLGYRPIISICGEKCYAWSRSKNSVIVINTSEVFKTDRSPIELGDVQEWQLSHRMVFEVTNVVPLPTSSNSFGGTTGSVNILLWGKNGLAVVTSQNFGTSVGEKSASGVQRFVKKTILLGEKTYIEHPRLEVIQAKWLPSTFPSHPKTVAVLNSDNYFRFYQIESTKGKEAISCGSVSIEPNGSATIPFVNRSGRFAADLEDESVADFDIGPCLPKSKYYPLFVLRESGCVSYVLVRFVGKNPVFFSEAHGLIPTIGFDTEDREATSILVSKQFPIFVAIGFCGGIITHSLVLPDFDESINDNGKIDQGQNVEEKFIYDGLNLIVKERLDLDFLAKSKSSENSIKLVADPLHNHRYVCIHDIGLHLVTAHFYPEIVKFFESDDDDEEADLPEVTKCSYQLLLRWRLGDEVKPERDLMALTFSNRKPQKLLCILQDLRSLIFELPDPSTESSLLSLTGTERANDPTPSTSNPGAHQNGHDNIFASGSNIEETCRSFLRRSSAEPYLCSKEEIPIRELEEYVIESIKLKSERMGGVEDGMQYLMRTVLSMQEKLKKMEELVQGLNGVRSDLQAKAEHLAERYEECVELDELHVKRLEAILARYHHASPVVTDKEKEWAKKMEAIKDDLPDLRASVELLKERSLEKTVAAPSKHDNLTDTQLLQIQRELRNQSKSLDALSYSLKQINEYMYYPALMSARPT